MKISEFDNYPSPWEGFPDKFINHLMKRPDIFSRKAIPVFWPTGVYSLGKCIRSIYSFPSFLPLPIYCDHGSFVSQYLDYHERSNFSRHHLTWFHLKYQENFNKKYNKKIFHIPSPQVMYRRKQKYDKKKNSKGTIIFVPHTSGNTEYITNKEKWKAALNIWIEDLIQEINPESPIVLCFHHNDLKKGYNQELKKRFPIVTAGNSQDKNFIDRFYFIISHFNSAIGQFVASDLFLCHEMGLDYSLYGKELNMLDIVVTGEDYVNKKDPYFPKKEKYIRNLFLYPKSNTKKNKNSRDKAIFEHLGLNAPLRKSKLRFILFTDFLLLSPYLLAAYLKFFLGKLKEFIIN